MVFLIPVAVGGLAALTGGAGVVAGVSAADKAMRANDRKCEADEVLADAQQRHEGVLDEYLDPSAPLTFEVECQRILRLGATGRCR